MKVAIVYKVYFGAISQIRYEVKKNRYKNILTCLLLMDWKVLGSI